MYGCGGHARSIVNVVHEEYGDIEIILIDENAKDNEIIMDCKVMQECNLNKNTFYIIAIGDNNKRSQIYKLLIKKSQGVCISVISKYAYIGKDTQIGKGTFIAPNAYVGPLAVIGNNTIINTGSIIEHETIIGDNTHIAPNATVCGRSQIGNNVFCGAGSTVIDKIKVCDDVIIGAGAVVVDDIIEPGTYVGVPAKKIS